MNSFYVLLTKRIRFFKIISSLCPKNFDSYNNPTVNKCEIGEFFACFLHFLTAVFTNPVGRQIFSLVS